MKKKTIYFALSVSLILLILSLTAEGITGYSVANYRIGAVNIEYLAILLILIFVLVFLAAEKGFEPTKEYETSKVAYQNAKGRQEYSTIGELVRNEVQKIGLYAKGDIGDKEEITIKKKGLAGILDTLINGPVAYVFKDKEDVSSDYKIYFNNPEYKEFVKGLAEKIIKKTGGKSIYVRCKPGEMFADRFYVENPDLVKEREAEYHKSYKETKYDYKDEVRGIEEKREKRKKKRKDEDDYTHQKIMDFGKSSIFGSVFGHGRAGTGGVDGYLNSK